VWGWVRQASTPEQLVAAATRAMATGNLGKATDKFRQAMIRYRENGDHAAAARLGHDLGYKLYVAQRWTTACAVLKQAIVDYDESTQKPAPDALPAYVAVQNAQMNTAMCQYWLGCSQHMLEDYEDAIETLRKASLVFLSRHYEKLAGDVFMMLGAVLRDYGMATQQERLLLMALDRFDIALRHFKAGMDHHEAGSELGFGQCFLSSAPVLIALNRAEDVLNGYAEARAMLSEHGDSYQLRECDRWQSVALGATGNG
jgi:tetratricopeptide (TPR) repeat protein